MVALVPALHHQWLGDSRIWVWKVFARSLIFWLCENFAYETISFEVTNMTILRAFLFQQVLLDCDARLIHILSVVGVKELLTKKFLVSIVEIVGGNQEQKMDDELKGDLDSGLSVDLKPAETCEAYLFA